MFKLLSMLSILAVGSSAVIGIVGNTTHVNNTKGQTLKQDTKLTAHSQVTSGIAPMGLAPIAVTSTLLQSFVTATKGKIAELEAISWDLSDIKLSLSSTLVSASSDYLISIVEDIITSDGKVLNETYQTKADEYGNYFVSIKADYITNTSDIKTIEMNSFHHQFNEYQLKNGTWRLTADINYEKAELEHTDHQFKSKIQLLDLGFKYYGHQIKEMFNNNKHFHDYMSVYINEVIKLEVTDIHVDKLVIAVENKGSFQLGSDADLAKAITTKYVFLSITSNKIQGTFNLLIKC